MHDWPRFPRAATVDFLCSSHTFVLLIKGFMRRIFRSTLQKGFLNMLWRKYFTVIITLSRLLAVNTTNLALRKCERLLNSNQECIRMSFLNFDNIPYPLLDVAVTKT